MNIRKETPQDEIAIHRVNALAFGREAEAKLADALRTQGKLALSMVAAVDSEVVAHVAFSFGHVALIQGGFDAMALGPVAVLPAHQRHGIGTHLIQNALAECEVMGQSLVFLLGHPSYYPRLGFKPAKPLGVRWVGDSSEGDCEPFMVYELKVGALAHHLNGQRGMFSFAPEFEEV